MEDGRNKRQPTGPNRKFYGFHRRQGVTGKKEALLLAADNRGRSLSSKKASTSTRSRSSSVRNNHGETADTRRRSHSTFNKKKQSSVLCTEEKNNHKQLSRPSSCSIDRSTSRPSSQRWAGSATYRSSTRGDDVRSQSFRSKSEIRNAKGDADVTNFSGSSRTARRSRSTSRNTTEAPNTGSTAAQSSSSAFSMHQGKPDNTKSTASSTRTFVVEVDESMNILKLNEVSAYSETPLLSSCRTSRIRSSQSTRDGVRQNRRRSLSCEPQMTRSRGKIRQNRRRSSSCEPPMTRSSALISPMVSSDEVQQNRRRSSSCELPVTRSSALYSPLYSPMMASSFTSRSRSGVNQSVTFSIHDENTEDIINRVSSYSRQVPQIRDSVDFGESLKESLSTEATSIINDDDEDSLGFIGGEPFRGVPSESEGTQFCSSGSTLAVVASAGEAEQLFGQANIKHFEEQSPSTRRSFIGYKPIRRTVPISAHSDRSEREENETSLLLTDAASCLEAQQKTRQESKRTSRIYKMINRYQ